ncbi:MAG TPA: DEAD/DEAH box helicase [Polyangiaceae bacterium]
MTLPGGASPGLDGFHPAVASWFSQALGTPSRVQELGWPPILRGESVLLFAPTGSGKTLAAFLAALERVLFRPAAAPRVRVVYVSPLKALGVDIEKNLRAPIEGIIAAAAARGETLRRPEVFVRSGDTSPRDRARFLRSAADILITTPESLFLLLTSNAARQLEAVETLIVDEIHAVLPTKRGSHLAVTLERLEAVRTLTTPLQRIGLSATQTPTEEAARLLGGAGRNAPRDVQVIDAREPPKLSLSVESTAPDLSKVGDLPGPEGERSIWPSVHARLVALVEKHRSTLIFVNNRGLAERLAASLNDLAGREIALAHHGSVARERRAEIEARLKSGELPALVATASLELGIDMGAIDLVVQIQAPPSVISGLQRVGRAGHQVGVASEGLILVRHRGELLPSVATTERMKQGLVESTRFVRNPLDVLAQQIVAIAGAAPEREVSVEAVYELVRRAAPFFELPRSAFEGVLDMLSGRYPSDEFAGLAARLSWDRTSGVLRARPGAKSLAIANAGTIADRGLFGVYFARDGDATRVGELDEEMVFESRPGDVFVLGASSWRIDDITHDRVLVTPAPGEPGRMPFWRGDGPGRPAELGAAIGRVTRELAELPEDAARSLLMQKHDFDVHAANNTVALLRDQRLATVDVPSDRSLVIERFWDQLGDHRVCVLSPFGRRVHAPWAIAVTARHKQRTGHELEAVWSDDGIVFRVPEAAEPPPAEWFLLSPDEADLALRQGLAETALFAARFRENAARALLLPRRRPGSRAPLWAQRKRSADLLRTVARFPEFPILLETSRECFAEAFDMVALKGLLAAAQSGAVRVTVADTKAPSPWSSSLLFAYAGNFVYEGDAPLAERRAQALTLDSRELSALLGEDELSELFDDATLSALERELRRMESKSVRHEDDVHDLLLALGELDQAEITVRAQDPNQVPVYLANLEHAHRIARVDLAGHSYFIACEDAARARDALGCTLPAGMPAALLEPVPDALGDWISRYTRTHAPFVAAQAVQRLGVPLAEVERALTRLQQAERVTTLRVPGGTRYVGTDVLHKLRRRVLSRLRADVEPVDSPTFCRFALDVQGLLNPAAGTPALERALEGLQGAPIASAVLETDVLPARVVDYDTHLLDALLVSGELVWRGLEPSSERAGKIALYFADDYPWLAPPLSPVSGTLVDRVRALLSERGASFFADIQQRIGGFGPDLLKALWELVWAGELSNDTLAPLRERPAERRERGRFRRRPTPRLAGSEGRWSLLPRLEVAPAERALRVTEQLLERYGVLARDWIDPAETRGGFSALYPILSAMEAAGKIRRGYFTEALSGAQFALRGAPDRLRTLRSSDERSRCVVLSAVDPGNPFGLALPWPLSSRPLQRAIGAMVVIWDGSLVGYLSRDEQTLSTFLVSEADKANAQRAALARALAELVDGGRRRLLSLHEIDGQPAADCPVTPALIAAGFVPGGSGLLRTIRR